jgi:hypothetical protein
MAGTKVGVFVEESLMSVSLGVGIEVDIVFVHVKLLLSLRSCEDSHDNCCK